MRLCPTVVLRTSEHDVIAVSFSCKSPLSQGLNRAAPSLAALFFLSARVHNRFRSYWNFAQTASTIPSPFGCSCFGCKGLKLRVMCCTAYGLCFIHDHEMR